MAILARIKKAKGIANIFSKLKEKTQINFSSYVDLKNIVFLHSKTRNEVISELIDSLSKTQKINDKESFFNKVLQREKIVSTGIGLGVAIPHAKSDEFKDFFIAIGVQNECKIKWQSIDKIPVRIVFLIGGPESKQTEYLKILSILTTAIKDETVRKDIINATSKEEILTIINHF